VSHHPPPTKTSWLLDQSTGKSFCLSMAFFHLFLLTSCMFCLLQFSCIQGPFGPPCPKAFPGRIATIVVVTVQGPSVSSVTELTLPSAARVSAFRVQGYSGAKRLLESRIWRKVPLPSPSPFWYSLPSLSMPVLKLRQYGGSSTQVVQQSQVVCMELLFSRATTSRPYTLNTL
jgi:hypothetical protein